MCVLAYFRGAQLRCKHLSACITELQRLVLIWVGNLFSILIQRTFIINNYYYCYYYFMIITTK